jgi:hypothetical protein
MTRTNHGGRWGQLEQMKCPQSAPKGYGSVSTTYKYKKDLLLFFNCPQTPPPTFRQFSDRFTDTHTHGGNWMGAIQKRWGQFEPTPENTEVLHAKLHPKTRKGTRGRQPFHDGTPAYKAQGLHCEMQINSVFHRS